MWILRDTDNKLRLYKIKPDIHNIHNNESGLYVTDELFLEFAYLTSNDDPVEIICTPKKYSPNLYNTSDIIPKSFGDYLVVIDSKQYGRRVAFKTFIPYTTDVTVNIFGDPIQQGWIVDEDETVKYWMEIPDWY